MTDDRPRPEYGEYASEAEQAAALERSGVMPQPPAAPSSLPAPSQQAPSHPPAPNPATRRPGPALQGGISPARAVDRVATIFMLSFGLVYLFGSAATYLNLAAMLDTLYAQMGIGEYTPTSMTAGVGVGIIVVQVIIWLIAAVWSYRRIRSGRMSWWVPFIAGLAGFAITATLLGILLAGDPAFAAFSTRA
ncbi:hypothetical protein BKA04_002008 [Cryobacterium mesophilum]|uniref:Uncharacterized protein n=1 Tax=Terrimesophilobacter mesophilus TaxID=433647 RepID=A0A4R8VCB6_9MICO|nr:DUF6264 family protein [Terrimesophilobacter mesophilus]MBB5633785.1 hypothetical protein [Terrimesophilobacter mesophilus]TFB80463.1 hypothetical protein E3N84_10740 [Terrimesophilobacter mesophilus]